MFIEEPDFEEVHAEKAARRQAGGPTEAELVAQEAESEEPIYYDPHAEQRRVQNKQRAHSAALMGEQGWARKVEAETAEHLSVHVRLEWVTPDGSVSTDIRDQTQPRRVMDQEPVGVSELHRFGDEGAITVLQRVTTALEDVPPQKQEDVYHALRDKAIKSLQGKKGSRRAAEAFVDRHLSEPLGERSPFTRDGLRDEDVTDLRPPSMLVGGILAQGETAIITGASGTGKSWLVSELSLAVAFGGEWLGRSIVETGPVRLFLPEGRVSYPHRLAGGAIDRGLLEPGATPDDLAELIDGRVNLTAGHTTLDHPLLEDHLRASVEANGTKLVVFDTLNRSLGVGQDENDANTAKQVMNMLARLATDTGCTFLLIHHPPHGEKRERGSRVWRDAPDARFLIYGSDMDVRKGRPVTLWNVKQRNIPEADPIGYMLRERTVEYDGETSTTCTVEVSEAVQAIPIADRIREYVDANPGLTKSAVISGVRGKSQEVSNEIDRLLASGRLENENADKSGPWSLHVAGEWESAEDAFNADADLSLSDVTGEEGPDDA